MANTKTAKKPAQAKTAPKTDKSVEKAEKTAVESAVEESVAEEKVAKNERLAGDENERPADDKVTLTKAELERIIADAVAKAAAPAPVIVNKPEDSVTLLFLGGIMDGSTVALGELGSIYRDGGTLSVTKSTFFQKLNSTTEYMLRTRQLIVTDGLTDEERERYNVLYRENELLTDRTYGHLLSYEPDELEDIYTKLCPQHRAIAAKIFRTGIENGDGRVTNEKLKRLAKIDRKSGEKNLFRELYERYAALDELDED